MKLIFLVILLTIFSFGCNSFSTEAQIRVSSNGQVNSTKVDKPSEVKLPAVDKTSEVKLPALDITAIDFKNFTFPDPFTGGLDKTFSLKNGNARPNPTSLRTYTLRKTYYFDITGDGKDEAITQVFADGCGEGCDSHSLFFVHTVENNQLKLIWKIATGTEAFGGLKSVAFKDKEIILESFGNCAIQNALITAGIDSKTPTKSVPTSYTRFVFSFDKNIFTQTSKDLIPMPEMTMTGYRPQISFGEQD